MDAQVPSNPDQSRTKWVPPVPAAVTTPTQVAPLDALSQIPSERGFGAALANALHLDPSNQGVGAVPADQMVQNMSQGQPAVPVAAPKRGLAAIFGAATPSAPVAPAAAAPAAGAAAPVALPQTPVDPHVAHQALEQAYGVKPMNDDDAFVAAHQGKISYRQLEHLNSMLPPPRTAADQAGHEVVAASQAAVQRAYQKAQNAQALFTAAGGVIDPKTGLPVEGTGTEITKNAFLANAKAHTDAQANHYSQMLAFTNPLGQMQQIMDVRKAIAENAQKR